MSFENVDFMRAELSIANANWIYVYMWELIFVNMNFMRIELCECNFYNSWALQMWIYQDWALWVWIYDSWALKIWFFMRTELWECEFYESWALQMQILWELGITNVNLKRAELCKCEFHKFCLCCCFVGFIIYIIISSSVISNAGSNTFFDIVWLILVLLFVM